MDHSALPNARNRVLHAGLGTIQRCESRGIGLCIEVADYDSGTAIELQDLETRWSDFQIAPFDK